MKSSFALSLCLVLALQHLGIEAVRAAERPVSAELRHLIDTTLVEINTITGTNGASNQATLLTSKAEYAASGLIATAATKPMYQAAAALCEALIQAENVHDQTVANLRKSAVTRGAPENKDLELSNSANNNRGWVWDPGSAGRANNAKEKRVNDDSKKDERAKGLVLTQGAIDAWTARIAQLRAGIEAAYEKELVAEKMAFPEGALAPAAPGSSQAVAPASAAPSAIRTTEDFRQLLIATKWTWRNEGFPDQECVFMGDGTFRHPHFVAKYTIRDLQVVELARKDGKAVLTFDPTYTTFEAIDFEKHRITGGRVGALNVASEPQEASPSAEASGLGASITISTPDPVKVTELVIGKPRLYDSNPLRVIENVSPDLKGWQFTSIPQRIVNSYEIRVDKPGVIYAFGAFKEGHPTAAKFLNADGALWQPASGAIAGKNVGACFKRNVVTGETLTLRAFELQLAAGNIAVASTQH